MSSQPGYDPEAAKIFGEVDPKLYDAVSVVLAIQDGLEVTTRHPNNNHGKRTVRAPRVGLDSELCGISEQALLDEQVARLSGRKR